jgi:hypothetical protein
MKIDLSKPRSLYDKIVSVEEFKVDGKWTSILSDGRDVKSNEDMKYNQLGLEGVVKLCINDGATDIQFLARFGNKEACYPDYRVEELIMQ